MVKSLLDVEITCWSIGCRAFGVGRTGENLRKLERFENVLFEVKCIVQGEKGLRG